MELVRSEKTDIARGSRVFAEAAVPVGLRHFQITYSTDDWPVSGTETVTVTLFVKRSTRAEVAVWSDTFLYQRASKRDTTQTVAATIDGPLPEGSRVRFQIDGPPLRTSILLEGE